ncbi:MAG: cytochrome P450 [Myxococcota bacterium]|nr:cytochrome P450 [Myxococcota bacterium]
MDTPSQINRMDLPPGPRNAALQSLLYMQNPYGYMARMRSRFGDIFSMPSMNGMLVLVNTPEAAQEILSGGTKDFDIGFGVDLLSHLLGSNSLLLLAGDAHRRERKILSPVFHGHRMKAYAPAMQRSALDRSAEWLPGETIVMQNEMQSVSLDVIIRAVLGVTEPERLAVFREAIRHAVSEVSPWPLFLAPLRHEFFGVGPWARFMRHKRAFDSLLAEEISSARSHPLPGEDILSRLVDSTDEEGNPLSDSAIRDHLVTLLIAGHETTATALAWAFYEITRHPEIERWLLDEITALGSEPDPVELADLPALHAVSREALRLHPIVPEFFRTVKNGYRLQNWDIPPGVVLAGSILSIQQNPELYPHPERFDPQRFLQRDFAPHEFAAFGGGHRYCLGSAFALSEMSVVLGTLLPRYALHAPKKRPLKTVRRHITLGPEGGAALQVIAQRFGPARH